MHEIYQNHVLVSLTKVIACTLQAHFYVIIIARDTLPNNTINSESTITLHIQEAQRSPNSVWYCTKGSQHIRLIQG